MPSNNDEAIERARRLVLLQARRLEALNLIHDHDGDTEWPDVSQQITWVTADLDNAARELAFELGFKNSLERRG